MTSRTVRSAASCSLAAGRKPQPSGGPPLCDGSLTPRGVARRRVGMCNRPFPSTTPHTSSTPTRGGARSAFAPLARGGDGCGCCERCSGPPHFGCRRRRERRSPLLIGRRLAAEELRLHRRPQRPSLHEESPAAPRGSLCVRVCDPFRTRGSGEAEGCGTCQPVRRGVVFVGPRRATPHRRPWTFRLSRGRAAGSFV
jgi:hypothetical protein